MIKRLCKTYMLLEGFSKITILGSIFSLFGIIAPAIVYKVYNCQTFVTFDKMILSFYVSIMVILISAQLLLIFAKGWDIMINDLHDSYLYATALIRGKSPLPPSYANKLENEKHEEIQDEQRHC